MKRIAHHAPPAVKFAGHAGYAARAVVFAIAGWSLVQSAWLSSTAKMKTLGEALASLQDKGLLFTIVAIGLLLFGVFTLFVARYRIIPDLDERSMRSRLA